MERALSHYCLDHSSLNVWWNKICLNQEKHIAPCPNCTRHRNIVHKGLNYCTAFIPNTLSNIQPVAFSYCRYVVIFFPELFWIYTNLSLIQELTKTMAYLLLYFFKRGCFKTDLQLHVNFQPLPLQFSSDQDLFAQINYNTSRLLALVEY